MKSLLLFVGLVCCSGVRGNTLPSFIHACREDDENLNECATKSAQDALTQLVKGVPENRFPPLNPLNIPSLTFKVPNLLEVNLERIMMNGYDTMIFKNVSVDTKNNVIQIDTIVKQLEMESDYDILGELLGINLNGKGRLNATITDLDILYTYHYGLVKRKGELFMKPQKTSATLKYKVKFYLANLFGTNEEFSKDIHNIIMKNWETISELINPQVEDTANTILTKLVNIIFTRVPYNQIFPK